MRYYLSYVDVIYKDGNHAALMLSAQRHESAPVEIVCEVGFAYALDFDLDYIPRFGPHQGRLDEEHNARTALYSKNTRVAHTTYELSNTEAEQFFRIINRDRRINISQVRRNKDPDPAKSIQTVSGPNYHKITNNCKTYALGVLKELGILEARKLSNFFIQRPGTHSSLLKTLSDNALSCPVKEKLMKKITSTLTQLNEIMEAHLENIENETPHHEARDKLKNDIQSILNLSNTLIMTKEKVGIGAKYYNTLVDIDDLLDSIAVYKDIKEKDDLQQKLEEIRDDIDEMDKLSDARELDFFWKQAPPLVKRFVLTNFTLEEKARYAVNAKTAELSYRLQNIVSYLNKHINSNRLDNSYLYQDLIDLKEITEEFKRRLEKQDQLFLRSIEGLTSEQLVRQCVNQGERLNEILVNFDKAISDFTPRTQESSVVIRWIKLILSYIKRDFFIVENAQSLIKAESTSAKKENKTLDSKVKFSNPDFFKSYCDIDRSESIDPAYTKSLN